MNAREFQREVVPIYRELFVVAMAICNNRDNAADAVQDTMVKLWNCRDSLGGKNSIRAYAITTVRHAAIDIIRRTRTVEPLEAISLLHVEPECNPGELNEIYKVLDALPDSQRRVVAMSAIDGLETPEIALATGLTESNVRQLLCRGRRKFKELYNKYFST